MQRYSISEIFDKCFFIRKYWLVITRDFLEYTGFERSFSGLEKHFPDLNCCVKIRAGI